MARRRAHTHVHLPAAAMALALVGTACGMGTGGSVSDDLVVWIMEGTNPDETAYFDAANAAFTEQTGVGVDVEFVPWSDAQNKISTAIAGGTVPDVVELGTTFVPEFADSGALHDLSGYVDDPYVYTQSLLRMGRIDDRIYGVPWYAAIRSIVYRTDIFEEHDQEVPENWAELRETAIALSEAEEDMIAFPIPGDAQYSVMPWIWGGGAELAVQTSDGTWVSEIDSDGGRAGMSFFTGLALEDGVSTTGAVNWNEIDVMESLAEERAIMAISGSANPKAILESNPDLEGRLGVFVIPGREDGYTDSFAGGSLLSVFEGTGQEEVAWEYVDHLTSYQFSSRWAEETGFFPGREEAVTAFAESEDPLVRPFAVQLITASRGTPVAPAWGRVEAEKVIVAMQQSILNGDATVDEATATAAAEIERILNGG
ncbi:sugar ABC transporter substrate-binding protein [Nocardiopsis sp. EMB25]|uniref:sugar ABC transporter substrate-binding protein n=1 Tax=Nocardiopsis TaxID=2013 RepID=UPI0003477006|nr:MULTISPECIES: sugar ABC transporter substrate-binding protein [Nocardiopsis]MCY9785034.1 sugar ABC transporter substrate-binding protein [Nocardiopsis sp. EMB25]